MPELKETTTESPSTPQRGSRVQQVTASITVIDDTSLDIPIDRRAKGSELRDAICQKINIAEKDFFGLIYEDKHDARNWLDLNKRIDKCLKSEPWIFKFQFKFYPPDPSLLQQDITRYYLCKQVQNDIVSGRLPCSFVTQALLGSYLVQSEKGNYDPELHRSNYLGEFKFAPNTTPELEAKIIDLHKTHKGETSEDAELHYLDNAKKLAMYGVDLHPAKDSEGVDIMLGVCSQGLLVYRDKLRMNRFAWPMILKISYKRNNFYIKIRPAEYEPVESTIGFKLANYRAAKKLWKVCVEHHTFFRLTTPDPIEARAKFPRFGSNYRYSGRTLHESRAATVEQRAPNFNRTYSGRTLNSRSMDGLGLRQQEDSNNEATKRHTMSHPPEHIPAIDENPKKSKKDKDKKPIGGVAVLPTGFGFGKKSKKADQNEDDEKENRDQNNKDRSPSPLDAETDQTISEGGELILDESLKSAGGDKSPSKKKEKSKITPLFSFSNRSSKSPGSDSEKNKEINETNRSPLAVFKLDNRKSKEDKEREKLQKKQELEEKKRKEKEEKARKKEEKRVKKPGSLDVTSGSELSSGPNSPTSDLGSPDSAMDRSIGEELKNSKGHTKEYEFTVEEYTTPKRPVQGFSYEKSGAENPSDEQSTSPNSGKRLTGLAFNYAPGEIEKVKKDGKEKGADEGRKTPVDYVESAVRKEQQVVPPPSGDIRMIEVLVDPKTGKLLDKQIDLKTGQANLLNISEKTKTMDPRKQKQVKLLLDATDKALPGQVDPKTGEYKGYFDPSTGAFVPVKLEAKTGELREHAPSFRKQGDLKVIDILVDVKTHKVVDGQVDLKTSVADVDNINYLLNNFDVSKTQPVKLLISGPTKLVFQGQIDPTSGEYLGFFEPKSGLFVPAGHQKNDSNSVPLLLGQDEKPLKQIDVLINRKNSIVADNQIDLRNGTLNLKGVEESRKNLDEALYTPVSIVYNPVSNSVLYGQVDLKTGEYVGKLYPRQESNHGFRQVSVAVDPKTARLLKNQIDLDSGSVNFEGISEKYKNHDPSKQTFVPVLVIESSNTVLSGQINTSTGEYLGHYDLDTLRFVPVKIDPRTGEAESLKLLNLLNIDLTDLKLIDVVCERGNNRILSNQITPNTGAVNSSGIEQRLAAVDPATHKRVQILTSPSGKVAVAGQFNPRTMRYLGYYDPSSLKLVPVENQIPSINSDAVRFVEVKVDQKSGKILSGQIDSKSATVNENAIDLHTGKNKLAVEGDVVHILVNRPTKKVVEGQLDLKHGKIQSIIDPVTWEWCEAHYDPKKGKLILADAIGNLDPVSGVLTEKPSEDVDVVTGPLPEIDSQLIQAVEVQLDPKNGRILDNVIDPKTGLVNENKIDLATGKLKNPSDPKRVITSHVLIVKTSRKLIPGQVEPKHGKLIGQIDPKSLKLVHVDLDPKTGHLVEGKVKGQVNPSTGALIEYEVDKSGKLKDPKTGKLIEYEIDQSTGMLIDPKTGHSLVEQIGEGDGSLTMPTLVQTPALEIKIDSQYPANVSSLGQEKLSPESQRALDMLTPIKTDYDEGIREGQFPYGGPGDSPDPNTTFIITEKSQGASPNEKKSLGLSGITAIFGKDDKKKKEKAKKEKDAKKNASKEKTPKIKKEKKIKKGAEEKSSDSSSDSDSDSSSGLSEYGEDKNETKDLKTSTKLKIPKLHIKGKKSEDKTPDIPVSSKSPINDEKSPKEEKGKTKIPKFSGWKTSSSSGADESPKKSEDKAAETGSPKSSKISGPSKLSSLFGKSKKSESEKEKEDKDIEEPIEKTSKKAPKVVKTTTKQLVVKDKEGVTENIEEKVEDMTSGEVLLSTHVNKAEGADDGNSPYVTTTAVTTRTATMHEDKGTKAKTSQVEEKTVAHSTTTSATHQEKRMVTQEVKSTTTLLAGETQRRFGGSDGSDSDDSGTNIDDFEATSGKQQGIVHTEKLVYGDPDGMTAEKLLTTSVPVVETEVRKVALENEDGTYSATGEIVSSQTISSKTRTVETITYKTERDGVVETRVEQKITIQSDGDPIDHDRALAEAIQEATAMNPDMTVEKIEIQQQQTGQ